MIRVKFKKEYIAIYGESFPIRLGQFLVGAEKRVKACVCSPCIFFRDESFEIPWLINHELIHFRQVFELLFVGVIFLYMFELLYARIFLQMSAYEAYHYSALEQEAYLNHHNPDYVKHRKLFSIFKYMKNKKNFSVDSNGIVTIQN